MEGAAAPGGGESLGRAKHRPRAPAVSRLQGLSIGTRLATVVLLTGTLTFGVVGVLASMRLDRGLHEQAAALGVLSERQLGHRLESEARLASARLDMLFALADRQVQALAQRPDIVRAVASQNEITIAEAFAAAARPADIDVLMAVEADGRVVGSNAPQDLMTLSHALQAAGLARDISAMLEKATRRQRGTIASTRHIGPALAEALNLQPDRIARLVVEPTFDEFGDVTGGILGVRLLAPMEPTLEQFADLARVGVVVRTPGGFVSHAGGSPVELLDPGPAQASLLAASGSNVARCTDHHSLAVICAFTSGAEAKESQEQMFKIGAQQSQSLMTWFLVLAAGSLLALVTALLLSVRHATRGLPQLSRAAASVAEGELNVPFAATGVGEVRSLGIAFEAMLSNLRTSLGKIRELAYFDQVTGLSNREKIRIDATACLKALPASGSAAFLFIDINRFKAINDTFGHRLGDRLLASFADRLTRFFDRQIHIRRIKDVLLARLGGDEFLAVVTADHGRIAIDEILDEFLDSLREPHEAGAARMMVGASIGVALYRAHGDDYESLLMNSDIAMYVAKRRGGSGCVMFTADAAEVMQERLTIENDLKIAVRERRLEVHYQPKVSCADGAIVGVEALARWHHPKRDYIPPSKFIMIAEEAGLVPDIGLFVLERAIEDFTGTLAGSPDISLAVNVSVIQLEDLNFASAVASILKRTGFPSERLELEITESMAMRDSQAVQEQIAGLRSLGVRIAIDDFGTGYSNLATLARLPIDTIKLDRSLVQDLPSSAEKQMIVRTIFGLARSFGFKTVAEGVETAEELAFVVQEGADIAQGYLFSPAVPVATLAMLLQPSDLRTLLPSPALLPGALPLKASGTN
jgi:diguanylate cyclase (GGDEF)-like protein